MRRPGKPEAFESSQEAEGDEVPLVKDLEWLMAERDKGSFIFRFRIQA